MTNSSFSKSDVILAKAIMSCFGIFMFEGKSSLFINGVHDVKKINKKLEQYGLKCYNKNSIKNNKFCLKNSVVIHCFKSWITLRKALVFQDQSNKLTKPIISYVLLFQQIHPTVRIFTNLFFIIYTQFYVKKRENQHISYCCLDEPNLTDTIEIWPKKALEQPLKRTIKSFIKHWVSYIRLCYKPLIFIFEIRNG
jgi:hypothetical protein